MTVTAAEIRGGLRALGLRAGDRVIVHGSLSSIGWVEGGADAVVDALLDVVTADGTVLMPTFTSRADEDPFHPERSPSLTGQITEALRTRPDAVRSDHPTHSVAAVGADAASLTRDHEPMASLGKGSPVHRMIEAGASILLLGVDHTSNSSIHVAEALTDLPYRDQTRTARSVDDDGEVEAVTANSVHCSDGFGSVETVAERAGILTRGVVGNAAVQLMDGAELVSLVAELLEDDPGFLLCHRPDCDRCEYARRALADADLTTPSDN